MERKSSLSYQPSDWDWLHRPYADIEFSCSCKVVFTASSFYFSSFWIQDSLNCKELDQIALGQFFSGRGDQFQGGVEYFCRVKIEGLDDFPAQKNWGIFFLNVKESKKFKKKRGGIFFCCWFLIFFRFFWWKKKTHFFCGWFSFFSIF